MNHPSIIRGFHVKKIKKAANSPRLYTPLRKPPPKLFPYPEMHSVRNSPAFPPSPTGVSKLNYIKLKKQKKESFKQPDSALKILSSNFIEKIRSELKSKFPIQKGKHIRSLSQSRPKKGFSNSLKVPQKSLDFPNVASINLKNWDLRKDSFPECSIDFRKLDLPYVENYFKGK